MSSDQGYSAEGGSQISEESTVRLEHCLSCGEALDRDSRECRFCADDNAPDLQTHPDIEIQPFLDQLGEWSEIKHEIVEKYAHAYTTILSRQSGIRRCVYIDGFAGSGVALDRKTGDLIPGSAYRALHTDPPFDELHFIEGNSDKASELTKWVGHDSRAHVHVGDANAVLLHSVLPRCRYEDRARGLCLLDPYGLTVDWTVLRAIGQMRSVEIFFNFMVVGANRNVLWRDQTKVGPTRRALLTRVWGDETWLPVAYREEPDLFGTQTRKISGNAALIRAYRERLRLVAGFAYVPDPIPMKNTRNGTVYYLFFASPNQTANRIVTDIFKRYRGPG
jgi:three-Cys-motif partner protein